MKQGRNDSCSCGSGKKYKQCCERKDKEAVLPQGITILSVAILIVVVGGVVLGISNKKEPKENYRRAPSRAPAPVAAQAQPPGPAPAGKVWSSEHGHWHDAPNPESIKVEAENTSPGQPAIQTTVSTGSGQPGPAPPGKVWSAEHGHWHNTAASGAPVNPQPRGGGPVRVDTSGRVSAPTPIPQPPGNSEPGKVWSPEHGHWHNAPTDDRINPNLQSTGPSAQPPGPAPEGKVWSAEHGHWHDLPKKDGGSSRNERRD